MFRLMIKFVDGDVLPFTGPNLNCKYRMLTALEDDMNGIKRIDSISLQRINSNEQV